MFTPKRGDQVLVNPQISGPAAGRLGCASGNRMDGHSEILDRHPDQPGAQLLGWFESDDLFPSLVGAAQRRITTDQVDAHLDLSLAALKGVPDQLRERNLGAAASLFAHSWVHSLAAAKAAGIPLDLALASFEDLCEMLHSGNLGKGGGAG